MTPLVIDRHGVELVATVDKHGVVPGTASVDAGVDLSFLHGAHQQLGTWFRTVGDIAARSGSFPAMETCPREFLAAVRDVIVTQF